MTTLQPLKIMEKRELTKDDRNAGMALGNMFYDLSGENSNAGGLAVVCAAFTKMVTLLSDYELFALVETNQEKFCEYMSSYGSDGKAYINAVMNRALEECCAILSKQVW